MGALPPQFDPGAERLVRLGITPELWRRVFAILTDRSEECANRVLTLAQRLFLLLVLGTVIYWLRRDLVLTLTAINGAFMAFYLVLIVYKFYLIHVSLGRTPELRFTEGDIAALTDAELPVYTVLVPLYREAESLPRLIENLKQLDYPQDKLEILLLMEEDDSVTQDAAAALDLPPFVRGVVVPDCPPKTKPKACNVGLQLATGRYLVIYDAEDQPEPDQLKKAVLGFRQAPANVVCLQAKLNFYNQRQNLLTRLFTAEYSSWFDLYLPGLNQVGAPIPLGGTSNHFDVKRLCDLYGWDPFNVTEDADLGVRLSAHRMATFVLDSTTWEEACSDVGFWIRQRSRWTKGYMQTYLVHMRRPLRLLWRLGIGRSLGFHLMIGGTPFSLLINPLYWTLTLIWFVFRWEAVTGYFPFPIILWALVCLFAGNFVFIYSSLLATYRRGYYDLVKYALLVPFYWMLMSVGAWKGFLQLITRPNYWEKTRHGLDLPAAPKPAADAAAEGGDT